VSWSSSVVPAAESDGLYHPRHRLPRGLRFTRPWSIGDRAFTGRALACTHHDHRSQAMSQGDKSSYTDKQKRQAQHIEESEKKEGKSKETAERIAWATVNKQDGGGKKH
jgi:hypothetical protein